MPPLAENPVMTSSPSEENLTKSAVSASDEYAKAAATQNGPKSKKQESNDTSGLFQVDLSKALVFQVGHLGDRYDAWVHDPIVSKQGPRLFESDLMEMFTNTYWWMIPLIWLPIVFYVEWQALQGGISASAIPLYMAGGLLIWTLLEYSLHRFLFHAATSTYWWNTIHYLLHGCHHKHPQDPNRLVFPPLLCIIFSVAIVTPFTYFLPKPVVYTMYGGGLLGYVCYDVTHFWLHFGFPTKFATLYKMRRYHLAHHFKNPSKGYGITNTLWDHVLGTLPPRPTRKSSS